MKRSTIEDGDAVIDYGEDDDTCKLWRYDDVHRPIAKALLEWSGFRSDLPIEEAIGGLIPVPLPAAALDSLSENERKTYDFEVRVLNSPGYDLQDLKRESL